MRTPLTSIACITLLATSTCARVATVLLSSSSRPVPEDYPSLPSLSAEHSRLVVAQRLGLSEFHKLSPWNDELLRVINLFGVKQEHIFAGSEERRLKAVMILEGVDDAGKMLPTTYGQAQRAFEIDNPPTAEANTRLLRDIYTQAASLRESSVQGRYSAAAALGRELNAIRNTAKSLNTTFLAATGDYIFAQSQALEETLKKYGPSSKEYQDAAFEVSGIIQPLIEEKFEALDLIFILMPPQQSGLFKRTTGSYGSYDMPSRRQIDNQPPAEPTIGAGRPDINPSTQASSASNNDSFAVVPQPPERPLPPTAQQEDEPAPPPEDGQPPPNDAQPPPNDDQPPPEDGPSRDTTPPVGILKACFASESDCANSTNSCSGHGSCEQKYTYGEGRDKVTCWACACEAEVENPDSNSRKTTYWAGPACQKKDVSMPFWFLGGVTLFFVLVISWGIGLLVQMGSEDLPSVIGAGVAGAKPPR